MYAYLDGVFGLLGTHLQSWATEKNKARENCRIAYHKVTPASDGPWSFTAETSQEIVARISPNADAGLALSQTNAGCRMPPEYWVTKFTDVVWQLKSTVNGIQPVRPVIALTIDIDLPPKTAFKFEKDIK